jgi:ribosomal protein S4E
MAAPSAEIIHAWRTHQQVAGVTFAHDDLVTLLAGEHAGNVGSLTSIEQLEPDVIYNVEIDTNFVVAAKQSEIEMAD